MLIAHRFSVQLNPAAVTTDVAEFEASLQAAARAACARERAQYLAHAIAMYQGPLLPGYYADWIEPERQRLAQAYLGALRRMVRQLAADNDFRGAAEYAARAVSADPLREAAYRDLMRLLSATGQLPAALAQYHQLERKLKEELGRTPSAATRQLAREIQTQMEVSGGEAPAMTQPARVPADAGSRTAAEARRPTRDRTPTLPTGTVTFLLTDIEGSTRLWEEDPEGFKSARADHHARLRREFQRHGGHEVKETGDGFLVAFASAGDALACAIAGQRALAGRWTTDDGPQPEDSEQRATGDDTAPDRSSVGGPSSVVRVRMALHTGDVEAEGGDYHGLALHRASRMLTAAHGGQILCSEATAGLLRRDLEAGVRLSDLGLYRLRDVPDPERLFQVEHPGLRQREFPPLRAEAGYQSNLPLQFNRFIGREAEIAELCACMGVWEYGCGKDRRPADTHPRPDTHTPTHPYTHTRLVTLTGTGGAGKTRLSLELAGRLVEPYGGAVWFVPLADVSDAGRISGAILDSMRIPRSTTAEPLAQAVEALSRQPSLLVLDNLEQVVEEGAAVVRALLERVPSLHCLVTSRQLLGLSGEREFQVPPLPVPVLDGGPRTTDDGPGTTVVSPLPSVVLGTSSGVSVPSSVVRGLSSFARCPSVALFVDRAQTVRPDFQVTANNAPAIAELCGRLEGIPLAIELAAARAQVLTPAQMLSQLQRRFDFLVSRKRDVAERQRTLQAAIDWSYRLLTPELQQFFARLSAFRGGWTLEAADAVCGSVGGWEYGCMGETDRTPSHTHTPTLPYTHTTALDAIAQLRECSLVQADEGAAEMRFRMLDTLREYGEEKLGDSEDVGAEVRRRHAEYFLRYAQEVVRRFRTPGDSEAVQALEADGENIRAAMEWAGGARLPVLFASLALAWATALQRRGLQAEAVVPVRGGLEAIEPLREAHLALYADLLRARAGLHLDHLQAAEARDRAQEALLIYEQLDDPSGEGHALNLLGQAAMAAGEFVEARAFYAGSLARFEHAGAVIEAAVILNNMGILERRDESGDKAAAARHLQEALRRQRASNDLRGLAETLNNLGVLAQVQGDAEQAWSCYAEALGCDAGLRHTFGAARAISNLGEIAESRGEAERARRLYAAAECLFERVKSPYVSYTADLLARAAPAPGSPEATIDSLRQATREKSLDELIAWATGE